MLGVYCNYVGGYVVAKLRIFCGYDGSMLGQSLGYILAMLKGML